MKILLVGISAKYIHPSPAVYLLSAYAKERYGIQSETVEFTVNQDEEEILEEIFLRQPDLLAFSCYIWNYPLVQRLCSRIKKLAPACRILLGGPEVSDTPKETLCETMCDLVLSGEGEESFSLLCLALIQGSPLKDVPSLTWREGEALLQNTGVCLPNIEEIPFIYQDLSQFENRILYYETQRGCPFFCQYCLSGRGERVRRRPMEMVKRELSFFLEKKVPQVKLLDRTFNSDRNIALTIWQFLAEHDNGVTNFHFELAAELLDEETLSFLETVREGLFQFEIGVQSTFAPTLEAVRRRTDLQRIAAVCQRLKKKENIHIHLDLIAGLPYETKERFAQSFNEVYALEPNQLQLGFLKLLKGSGLYNNREKFQFVYDETPPYSVLATPDLSFWDMVELKDAERVLELYYNSGRFLQTLRFAVPLFPSPYCFYRDFAAYLKKEGALYRPKSAESQYRFLYEFLCERFPSLDPREVRERERFDYCSHERQRKPFTFFGENPAHKRRKEISDLYDSSLLGEWYPPFLSLTGKEQRQRSSIEGFSFDPVTGEQTPCLYLFDYARKDIWGNGKRKKLPERLK